MGTLNLNLFNSTWKLALCPILHLQIYIYIYIWGRRCCILILWLTIQTHNTYTSTYTCRIITTTQFFRKICTCHFIWKGCIVRGSWRPNRTAIYWPSLLWPSAFLSRFPGLLNRRLGGPALCWVLAFSTISCLQNWSGFQTLWSPKHSLNFLCTVLYNSSTPTP